MKGCAAFLVVLVGCAGADPDVRIERQSGQLATATSEGWAVGGTVLVGTPGTFAFPQLLSLRLTLVDGHAAPPAEGAEVDTLPITGAALAAFGDSPFEVSSEPSCDATACVAELRILAEGRSMVQVHLTGDGGDESDCFYFAIYENPDPAAVSAAYRDTAEAEQDKCRQDLLD